MSNNPINRLNPKNSRCDPRRAVPVLKGAFLLGAALLTALPAVAAVEEPPGAMDLVWQGVNLAVLLAILTYFLRKPVAAFLRGAAGRQKEAYEGARQDAKDIAAEMETQKKKIEDLEQELQRMVEAAKTDAEEERRQMTEAAEAQAERIRAQAGTQVEQQLAKAIVELRAQLADETVKLAEGLIRSRMDDDRRQRLVSDYIQQIGAQR